LSKFGFVEIWFCRNLVLESFLEGPETNLEDFALEVWKND
jgi:hypothetical protein